MRRLAAKIIIRRFLDPLLNKVDTLVESAARKEGTLESEEFAKYRKDMDSLREMVTGKKVKR
jgi:hypothetical protein